MRAMSAKFRESIYGASIRASVKRAREARKEADRLACKAWNDRCWAKRQIQLPAHILGRGPSNLLPLGGDF